MARAAIVERGVVFLFRSLSQAQKQRIDPIRNILRVIGFPLRSYYGGGYWSGFERLRIVLRRIKQVIGY